MGGWEVLIEILLHITSDINTDRSGGDPALEFGPPAAKQQRVKCEVELVRNECDNMRAGPLPGHHHYLLGHKTWASPTPLIVF